jgi:hypothetical protein
MIGSSGTKDMYTIEFHYARDFWKRIFSFPCAFTGCMQLTETQQQALPNSQ